MLCKKKKKKRNEERSKKVSKKRKWRKWSRKIILIITYASLIRITKSWWCSATDTKILIKGKIIKWGKEAGKWSRIISDLLLQTCLWKRKWKIECACPLPKSRPSTFWLADCYRGRLIESNFSILSRKDRSHNVHLFLFLTSFIPCSKLMIFLFIFYSHSNT